jgi:hypothetical protein
MTDRPNSPLPYALFISDPINNTTTFAGGFTSKEAALKAQTRFKDHLWFALYKFNSHELLFHDVPATKWSLDTKFANKTATELWRNYTPMETAYCMDGGAWYFKTF